ncbi:hypothetical protein GALMADRAFT_66627 [Galerina marginata CBS 339.88]|uniref:Sugar phosphate transporter domain-containing protein n=1 Tax=Galerina marginata (strain CBS 339.88) TaxID=685588 RepID=A0A067TDQ8_GALM3|nr:hypothetical protein GALMADRAFT_66627 [Galerina marginata CBS 339.88]
MDGQPPLPLLSGGYAKSRLWAKGRSYSLGDALLNRSQRAPDPSRSKIYDSDGELAERPRVVRGRTIRVNTLHQRIYRKDDEFSPLAYPDGFYLRPELLSDSAEAGTLPHVPPFAPPSPSKASFRPHRPAAGNYLTRLRPEPISRRVFFLLDSPSFWLALYFTLNLSLTLYNKSILIHFPFPYTLTALHALCGTIGTFILLRLYPGPEHSKAGASRPLTPVSPLQPGPIPKLNGPQMVVLFMFSLLYTLNIVVSNASLQLVTVPFHQVVRASAPFFTIMFAAVLLGKRCNREKLLSLVPVVVGVGLATYGDYYFTAIGFFLTLLGTLLASLKTIFTNVILVKPTPVGLPLSSDSTQEVQPQSPFSQTSFSSFAAVISNRVFSPTPSSSPTYPTKPNVSLLPNFSFALPKLYLSPIHLLCILSPLAFVQTTLLAHFTGELARVRWHLSGPTTATIGANAFSGRMWLLLNGVLAFFLNVVSFNANRRVGPLGMTVAANVKQVLTVLCAVVIFDLTITPANGLGIALTLIGGVLYATVELQGKRQTKIRII